MPNLNSVRSSKGRWVRYNRFRQAHPQLDRARREETSERLKAESVLVFVCPPKSPKPKLGNPFAKIRIDFSSGRTTTLTVRETPFGLNKSATRCGSWVSREIQFEQSRI